MKVWEDRIKAPDIKTADYRYVGGTRKFHLIVEEIRHNILSEVAIRGLGYNGSTPGPLVLGKQGEWIEITVENRSDKPTALHVHGYAKPNQEDGVPDIEPTPLIEPGTSYSYRFFLWQSGTFFYHSAQEFQAHKGLMGPFVVLPEDGPAGWQSVHDRDYVFVLQEWEIPQPGLGKVSPGTFKPDKFARNPNFFTINGKAFPDTSNVYVSYGQRVRLRFINKSNDSHSMHLHGHDFRVVAVDGFPASGQMQDTINVPSGVRVDVEFTANNPGIWPMNGTKTFHESNNGERPGGMIARFKYL